MVVVVVLLLLVFGGTYHNDYRARGTKMKTLWPSFWGNILVGGCCCVDVMKEEAFSSTGERAATANKTQDVVL